jgi:S1-C subfamily serine protease
MMFLAALSIVAVAEAPAASEFAAEDAFKSAKEYTVRIQTQIETPFIGDDIGSYTGAGFLVDAKRGWIVTNAHVVGWSPSEVRIAFYDEEFQPARKLYVDSFADIAVLELERPVIGRHAARIDRATGATVGEPVGAFGHPLGIPFTGTRGIVSGNTDQFGPDLVQIDATVDHGNSGGPVIALRDRRIIGIATAGAGGNSADRLNFATPIGDVSRILDLLRRGVTPCPPRLGFALLVDEDDRTTMRVGCSFDSTRWPLRSGDRILGVEGLEGQPRTLHDIVTALRGWSGSATLTVERGSGTVTVETRPAMRAPLVERRGVSVDGALFAAVNYEDGIDSLLATYLTIQSIEPSSAAEMHTLRRGDMLYRIDGHPFEDVKALSTYMQERPAGPISIIIRRGSPDMYRVYDFHFRELPGEDIKAIGPEPEAAVAGR